ncbi:MAG: hypothetical protein IJ313_06190 [Clostridia bacterium]|nr:hypothetical protein [Clostridia bacterium]
MTPGGERMPDVFRKPTQRERSKYQAAQAAGLLDRVLEVGWAGLSAKESGKIGGILAHMKQGKD